jgi:hypothetical protein
MRRISMLFCTLLLVATAVFAQNQQFSSPSVVVDNPAMIITTGSATSTSTLTSGSHEANVQFSFGTVAGTYTGCTVQAYTAVDGANYFTLGQAQSVTVTSNKNNVWTLVETTPSSAPSFTLATGFGQRTQYVFSCSSYGTSAPVTITTIYYPIGIAPQLSSLGGNVASYFQLSTSVPSSSTAVTTANTVVQLIYCNNFDSSAHTITIQQTDSSYVVGPAYSLSSLGVVSFINSPIGVLLKGIKWSADSANKIYCWISGQQ